MKNCTVKGCRAERRKSPKTGGYINGFCLEHGRDYARVTRRHYCTIRMPDGTVEDWVHYQQSGTSKFLAAGGKITAEWFEDYPGDKWPTREELLLGEVPKTYKKAKEPNKQTTPPPPPKPRKPKDIPPSTLVTPGTPTTPRWNQSATSKALHYNLWLRHGACEFTGAPAIFCNEGHILARKVCRSLGHPEWVDVEENTIYIQAGLNDAMERAGYWLHPHGWLAPPYGEDYAEDYAEWMKELNIHKVRIEMYGLRAWFATMAMMGEATIEPFDNGPFRGPWANV